MHIYFVRVRVTADAKLASLTLLFLCIDRDVRLRVHGRQTNWGGRLKYYLARITSWKKRKREREKSLTILGFGLHTSQKKKSRRRRRTLFPMRFRFRKEIIIIMKELDAMLFCVISTQLLWAHIFTHQNKKKLENSTQFSMQSLTTILKLIRIKSSNYQDH